MSSPKKPEFTPYPPRGIFYYRFLNKSPLGVPIAIGIGVKIFHAFMAFLLLIFMSTGKAVSQITENSDLTIKIGLLIPNSEFIAAIQGAELAIRKANEKGGLNGRNFQLVPRSMEGPWGTGSKQAVNLIFEEKVWALLGSHDGRNAHLVEQAATKSQVVFVSAWSGDPTLSQAFVPWFFNCVPNDRQQVASLIEEIYNKKKFNKIAVVSGNDYDSKITMDNFLKSVKKSGKPDPVQFNYGNYIQRLNVLTDEINKTDSDCILIFCRPWESSKLVREIRLRGMNLPLFGSLMLLNEDEISPEDLKIYDNILSVPAGDWSVPELTNFTQEYQKAFNKMPGMVASYSFDGTSVLLEAIRNAGSDDRELIQKSLGRIQHNGVTGPIQFDDKGNRSGKFKIMRTLNGVPASPE